MSLLSDLRLAARRLAATPAFTIFAILSLAIGIGVTTSIYSVVDSIFLRDLGISEPHTAVFVVAAFAGQRQTDLVSPPDFADLRARQQSFAAIAASARFFAPVTSPTTTEVVPAEAVDGAYFTALGVQTIIGRPIQGSDDRSVSPVAVLGYRLWRSRFASDATIVGRHVRLSGRSFQVIGVAPESFEGPHGWFTPTMVWVPLSVEPLIAEAGFAPSTPERDRPRLTVIGRLRPGRPVETASAELTTIAAALDAAYPRRNPFVPRPEPRRWKAASVADVRASDDILRRFGLAIVGLAALVLVVACTNLSNLVLARGTGRQHEFAVRRALGGSRWRLVREQGAESAWIAAAGGAASFIVIEAFRAALDVDLPLGASWMVSFQPSLNLEALVAAALALLLSLVVFGLEPALQLTRATDLRTAMDAAGGSGPPRTKRHRFLLRWQVAISTGFFIIATMCVKYTIAEARHDPGIDLDRLAVAILNFDTPRQDEQRVRRTLDRVAAKAAADPAVRAVTVSTGLPFGTPRLTLFVSLSAPDRPPSRYDSDDGALAVAATPSIFGTIGVRILRGRGFAAQDDAGAPKVVVLTEVTARHLFGTVNAVGRPLRIRPRWMRGAEPVTATVVGVARDTDVGMMGPWSGREQRLVYLPLAQQFGGPPALSVTVRAAGRPAMAVRALRDAIREVDPDLAIQVAGTGRTVLGGPSLFLRAAGFGALGLGGITLLLAMVGLYGIQSHVVARRTREIGVRMSLGATTAQIKRMVLRDGYRPIFEGLAIGLFIGFAGRAVIRAFLVVRIGLVDPWVLALVPIALVLAGFCACYLPAARASRVDPNVALRNL